MVLNWKVSEQHLNIKNALNVGYLALYMSLMPMEIGNVLGFLQRILQISCSGKNVNISACCKLKMMLRLLFNPIFVENLTSAAQSAAYT